MGVVENYAIHVQDVNEPQGEITWEIQQTCTQGKVIKQNALWE